MAEFDAELFVIGAGSGGARRPQVISWPQRYDEAVAAL